MRRCGFWLCLAMGAVGEVGSIPWMSVGWQAWAAILYLGAIGTVLGFIWYYEGIRAVGPSRTAVFTRTSSRPSE